MYSQFITLIVSAVRRIVFSRFHPAVAAVHQLWRGKPETLKSCLPRRSFSEGG
jgi:hypothetical protein